MELSPFVHHHHHHGKKGRGGGGGGGGGVADLWDVIDPLEIALTVLEEDAPRRARARDRRAIANTNVDWVETPEAHIFKVDLPGISSSSVLMFWFRFIGDVAAVRRAFRACRCPR
jgi:HSP20 family protein